MEPVDIFALAQEKMDKAVAATQTELSSLRTGRANPLLLERIYADYYGTPTPINQMGNISVQGGQSLIITPYDKTALMEIEKAISKSDLGLPPQNDGSVIRLNIPPLTEETRKQQVKLSKQLGEEGKVAARNIRRDMMTELDRAEKELNLSEDDVKTWAEKIDKLTQDTNKRLDKVIADKEADLMVI